MDDACSTGKKLAAINRPPFYHSRPGADPLRAGRRMCAENDAMPRIAQAAMYNRLPIFEAKPL